MFKKFSIREMVSVKNQICNGKKVLFAALLLLVAPVSSYAGQGHAFVPGLDSYYENASNSVYTDIKLSNISATPVQVKVSLYKQDGTLITDDGPATSGKIHSIYPGGSYTDNISDATVSFTLDPHKSTRIEWQAIDTPNASIIGYGVIEWSSAGADPQQPLLADGYIYERMAAHDISMGHALVINQGLPF